MLIHYEKVEKALCRKLIWGWLERVPVSMSNGKVYNPTPTEVNKIWESVLIKFAVDPNSVNPPGINCKNGVLEVFWEDDLPGVRLVPHDPLIYYTYVSEVSYNKDANPKYCDSLMECIDPSSASIFFKILGASLDLEGVRKRVGRSVKAAILSGEGSNGKDSVRQCLFAIYGRIGNASISDFSSYDAGRKFTLSKLLGIKVNWCSENAGYQLEKVQSLKAAITGEPLDFEKKGVDEREMNLQAVFLFNVNRPPSVKTGIEAITSRFCVIKFDKTFKKNADARRNEIEADPRFRYDSEFISALVCPGFLNRMVDGLKLLISEGIDYTPVDKNIREIKENSNHFWKFASEVGFGYGEGMVSTREIYAALREWYIQTGTLEINELNHEVWHDQSDRTDKNIKSPAQVRSRVLEAFPKATVRSERTATTRTTYLEGVIFYNNDGGNTLLKSNPSDPSGIIIGRKDDTNNENIAYSTIAATNGSCNPENNCEQQSIELNGKEIIPYISPYKFVSFKNGEVVVDEEKINIYSIPPKRKLPKFTPKNLIPYDKIGILYLDIETLGENFYDDEIISIGVWNCKGERKLINRSGYTEKEMLIELFATVKEYQQKNYRVISGHFVYGFDLPFIIARAEVHDLESPVYYDLTYSGDYKKQMVTSASVNGKPIEFNKIVWNGMNIIDTYVMLGCYDKMFNTMNDYKLKGSVIQLGLREERRTELFYQEIVECYKNSNWDLIEEYLEYDLEDTKLLTNFLLPSIYYQMAVVPNMSLQDLALASPAKKWERIIENYYSKKGVKMYPQPDQKLTYSGGRVEVNPGLYSGCAKIDVSGMYPSIQKVYQLSSLKDKDGIYLSVIDFLSDERDKLKKKYEKTKNSNDNAHQTSNKRLNNGGYGFSGTGGYSYNCMRTAALITAYGRKIVTKMLKVLLEEGCEIIEVDTDGIYFKSSDCRNSFEKVQLQLPPGIKIDLEYEGVDIYCPLAKNYIIFGKDETIIKGSKFKARNKCVLIKEFPVRYARKMLESKGSANDLYTNVRESLISGTYPLEELKIKQRIPDNSKVLVEAGIGKPGDVVEFYWGCERTYKTLKTKKNPDGTPVVREKVSKIPVTSGEYYPEFYIDQVNTLKGEVDEVVLMSGKTEVANEF